ncbi:hypothetical protein THAOC_06419, partial [Thalassiosira oceanica]
MTANFELRSHLKFMKEAIVDEATEIADVSVDFYDFDQSMSMSPVNTAMTNEASKSGKGSKAAKSKAAKFMFTNNTEVRTAIQEYLDEGCTTDMTCSAILTYGEIADWDVSRVQDFSHLFEDEDYCQLPGADTFNEPIGNWDTGSATNMESMFSQAQGFNQPLNYDTSKVEDSIHQYMEAEDLAFAPFSADTPDGTTVLGGPTSGGVSGVPPALLLEVQRDVAERAVVPVLPNVDELPLPVALKYKDRVGLLRRLGAPVERRDAQLRPHLLLPGMHHEGHTDVVLGRELTELLDGDVLHVELVVRRALRGGLPAYHELHVVEYDVHDVVHVRRVCF